MAAVQCGSGGFDPADFWAAAAERLPLHARPAFVRVSAQLGARARSSSARPRSRPRGSARPWAPRSRSRANRRRAAVRRRSRPRCGQGSRTARSGCDCRVSLESESRRRFGGAGQDSQARAPAAVSRVPTKVAVLFRLGASAAARGGSVGLLASASWTPGSVAASRGGHGDCDSWPLFRRGRGPRFAGGISEHAGESGDAELFADALDDLGVAGRGRELGQLGGVGGRRVRPAALPWRRRAPSRP